MAFIQYRSRILTGAALIALAALIAWIDHFYLTWGILGGIYLLAFYEASNLFGVRNNASFAYAALLWVLALFYPYSDDLSILIGVVFAGVVAYRPAVDWKLFLPFIYPTAGMLFFLTLYKDYKMLAMIWLVTTVVLADVGAFVIGKLFGKKPFCESSPNKTVEGAIGGVLLATAGGIYPSLTLVDLDKAIIITFFTAVAALYGDLFESYLKRQAQVKDSGAVLPGHGGILDRIDGYLFASVVMVILLRGLV